MIASHAAMATPLTQFVPLSCWYAVSRTEVGTHTGKAAWVPIAGVGQIQDPRGAGGGLIQWVPVTFGPDLQLVPIAAEDYVELVYDPSRPPAKTLPIGDPKAD
jgi:hypothetical protein